MYIFYIFLCALKEAETQTKQSPRSELGNNFLNNVSGLVITSTRLFLSSSAALPEDVGCSMGSAIHLTQTHTYGHKFGTSDHSSQSATGLSIFLEG